MQALILTFVIGMISFPVAINVKQKVQERRNTGKPIYMAGNKIGYVVVIRYNGVKRWASVVDHKVGLRAYYNQDEAVNDVTNRHLENSEVKSNTPPRARELHFS